MRALLIVFLVILLGETGCTTEAKGLEQSDMEKVFPQVLANGKDITDAPMKLNCLEIKCGKKSVVSISFIATTTTLVVYLDGEAHKVITYDITGEKIAECSVVGNLPHTGTIWNLTFGAGGLKNSTLLTYKNGSVVAITPYKETEIENLFKQVQKLR